MSLLLTFITSLMLGMRHATDSDHVVAVTAIASRERSVGKAAWLVTLSIAAPSLLLASRMVGMQRSLRLASGAVSIVFGLYLAHKVGFADGLFTSTPSWDPR